jgi:GNAT superfamily N-acetyltransferase
MCHQGAGVQQGGAMMAGISLNPDGYTDVPAGKIATVVTSLEMRARPAVRPDPPGTGHLALEPLGAAAMDRYLAIYRVLGERWMWFSRLVMARDVLADILGNPLNHAFALTRDGSDCGLLELDFRVAGECEIAFFGLYEQETGGAAGRWLMNRALDMAWAESINRVWVHTCTFDHPRAVDFYRRSGFRPYLTQIEVVDDPRLNGKMRREAAPHVPIIGG